MTETDGTGRSSTLSLVLAWAAVSIPLAWGVYETMTKAVLLFR
jgi:hypothetical protein